MDAAWKYRKNDDLTIRINWKILHNLITLQKTVNV